jgi:hypothetical protein
MTMLTMLSFVHRREEEMVEGKGEGEKGWRWINICRVSVAFSPP